MELVLGAIAGAIAGEILGVAVTLFFLERLLKRREYGENRRVRRFAYARTFEIASSVLTRLLPRDLFVEYPAQVQFGDVPAKSTGRALIRVESEQGLAELLDRQCEVDSFPIEDRLALRGYLAELDTIIMGFGRLSDSAELEDVVALSRSLNVFVRSEDDRGDNPESQRNQAQFASYLSVLLRAEQVIASLERLMSAPEATTETPF